MKGNYRSLKKMCWAMLLMLILPSAVALASAEASYLLETPYDVTLKASSITVDDAMKQISNQTGIAFSYSESTGKINLKNVDIQAVNAKPEVFLKTLLDGTGIQWVIKDNMIGLYSKTEKASEIMQTTAPGQDSAMRNIIGKVVDDKGAPMAGAMVMIEGSNSGTTTDYNGMFSIKAAADQTISVSYLGFTTASVKVTTADYYEVIMNPDSEYLDDVVVTALGIKRSEKALGYSVQKVATEGLTSAKGIAISSSLTGRVAGLNVRNSTEFFDAPTLRLRGEAPTIIIDGIPYSSISLSQLSPDDIESIDVLKGATASALYGAQASTGVIMVTTKKGSEAEGLNVEVNSNTMVFSGFLAFPEVHGMYASGTNGKMNYNSCWGPRLDVGAKARLYNPNTYQLEEQELTSKGKDNFKNFLQFGMVTNNSISVSQKGKYGSVRASMSHVYNRGQYPNQDLNKFNFTIGGELKYKKFSMTASAAYNKHHASNYHGKGYAGSYIYNLVIWGSPQYDVREFRNYWVAGKEHEQQNWFEAAWYNNPYFAAYEIIDQLSYDYMNATFTANYEITPWLKAVLRAGGDAKTKRDEWRNPMSAATGAWGKTGKYGVIREYTGSINADAMLMADKRWGKFRTEALFGGNLYYYTYDYMSSETSGGLSMPGFYSLNASIDPIKASSSVKRQQINSLYGKATFSWDDTYFVDVTGRNDWSSTMDPLHKSYFYPSVAGSVILSEIIPMPQWWDFLKARGSWTMTKLPAGIYEINNAYSIQKDVWSGNKGATYPSTLKGGSVLPETSQTLEVGLATKFFKNRLFFDAAYYQKKEYDFIQNAGVSPSTGFSSVQINSKETRLRRGFEFVIGGRPVETKDFTWDITTNWAHDNYTYGTIDPDYSDKRSWVYEGADYDWIQAWDWQRDHEGNLVIAKNGLPVWMPVQTKMGKDTPDLIFGISNTFRYKNWSLSFSFDGRIGGLMWAKTYQVLMHAGSGIETDTKERYEEVVNGNITFIPKGVNVVSGSVSYDESGNIIEDTRTFKPNDIPVSYEAFTSYYYGPISSSAKYQQCVLDATFIKLRDFSITYDFPKSFCEKLNMKGGSVGVTGQNVLLWTKEFKYADPDTGHDDINAPSQRYLGFNFKLNF